LGGIYTDIPPVATPLEGEGKKGKEREGKGRRREGKGGENDHDLPCRKFLATPLPG